MRAFPQPSIIRKTNEQQVWQNDPPSVPWAHAHPAPQVAAVRAAVSSGKTRTASMTASTEYPRYA